MADLVPGLHEGRFEWHGRFWTGPSDTGKPEGEPFPPGEYEFMLSAWVFEAESGEPIEILATRRFHLVP